MPIFPTFSLDELTPEPVPRKPAKIVLIPWMPIPRFTAFGGGFFKSATISRRRTLNIKRIYKYSITYSLIYND